MSQMGHERHFKRKSRISAFPPIPDISLLLLLKSQTKLAQDHERLRCPPPALTVLLENSLVPLTRQLDPFSHWRCFPRGQPQDCVKASPDW